MSSTSANVHDPEPTPMLAAAATYDFQFCWVGPRALNRDVRLKPNWLGIGLHDSTCEIRHKLTRLPSAESPGAGR